MFSSRSRKSFLGALFLTGLLSWVAIGHAQDSGRKITKKVTPPYPSILKSKGIGGVVRLKVFVKPDGSAYSLGFQDGRVRSEEHTSELQSPYDLVCRLLLEKKK